MEPFGDVVFFSRERARRREGAPLKGCPAARTGRETCPYTIKDWFLCKKACYTGFVALYRIAKDMLRGKEPVWQDYNCIAWARRARRRDFGISSFISVFR